MILLVLVINVINHKGRENKGKVVTLDQDHTQQEENSANVETATEKIPINIKSQLKILNELKPKQRFHSKKSYYSCRSSNLLFKSM